MPEKPPTSGELCDEFIRDMGLCLSECVDRIEHCLDQLNDDQVWWRPHDSLNAIGNLLLHLCGNLRQWVLAGVDNADHQRDRPAEFSARGPISKSELIGLVMEHANDARRVMAKVTADRLLEVRRIQGFDVTVMRAIIDSISHFKAHTQEIIFLTRIQLSDEYRFFWQPSTPEQGA